MRCVHVKEGCFVKGGLNLAGVDSSRLGLDRIRLGLARIRLARIRLGLAGIRLGLAGTQAGSWPFTCCALGHGSSAVQTVVPAGPGLRGPRAGAGSSAPGEMRAQVEAGGV